MAIKFYDGNELHDLYSQASDEKDAMLVSLVTAAEDARQDYEFSKKRLVEESIRLSDRLRRLAEVVESGGSVNELGEVQGRGQDVDRHCANINGNLKAYRHLCALVTVYLESK